MAAGVSTFFGSKNDSAPALLYSKYCTAHNVKKMGANMSSFSTIKSSALAIGPHSSEASAEKELSLSRWCVASLYIYQFSSLKEIDYISKGSIGISFSRNQFFCTGLYVHKPTVNSQLSLTIHLIDCLQWALCLVGYP